VGVSLSEQRGVNLSERYRVDDIETLNVAMGPRGALEAVLEAKEQGLVKHIGITGHRPFVHVEALKRFHFDTVLFPLNRVLAAHVNDSNDFTSLLEMAQEMEVGTIAIKAVCKQPWESPMHMYRTWYEPFDEQAEIDKSLWYALTHGITSVAMPGDLRLWPMVLDAAERFRPLDTRRQEEVVAAVAQYRPLFPR